jgi:hypothetical protein
VRHRDGIQRGMTLEASIRRSYIWEAIDANRAFLMFAAPCASGLPAAPHC